MKIRIEKFEIEIPSDWTERYLRSINEGEYQRDVAEQRAGEQHQSAMVSMFMALIPLITDALNKLIPPPAMRHPPTTAPFEVDPSKGVDPFEESPFKDPLDRFYNEEVSTPGGAPPHAIPPHPPKDE